MATSTMMMRQSDQDCHVGARSVSAGFILSIRVGSRVFAPSWIFTVLTVAAVRGVLFSRPLAVAPGRDAPGGVGPVRGWS